MRADRTIVDLFAGTAGMGLATLSLPAFKDCGRIIWTAEQNERYVGMIQRNYSTFGATIGSPDQLPGRSASVDLAKKESLEEAAALRRRHGSVDLMLAGPPCQGFSLANRLTRSHQNPLNKLSLLVTAYVAAMHPRVLILENVPGIRTMAASAGSADTTVDLLTRRLQRAGYVSKVVLLDAASYGVPQFRLRSFLIAARDAAVVDVDAAASPPPTHGPKRRFPYVSVRDALSDLPGTSNGSSQVQAKYKGPPTCTFQRQMRRHSNGMVLDHVTTKHSPYVLERYARIPQGGNWTAIRRCMRNYKDASRTHLNIYSRLSAAHPAKTIGNFRKAMTIHPWEDRGLSLREAARLQSLPDWMTFTDPDEPRDRVVVPGLNAYQQQIGNAVSFLLTRALVAHVVRKLGIAS